MNQDEIEVNRQKRTKETGQYEAIWTDQAWSIKDLLHGQNENRFLLDHRGKPRAVQARWAAKQNTGFAYSCPQNIQIPFCSHAFSRGLRQPHRFAL